MNHTQLYEEKVTLYLRSNESKLTSECAFVLLLHSDLSDFRASCLTALLVGDTEYFVGMFDETIRRSVSNGSVYCFTVLRGFRLSYTTSL